MKLVGQIFILLILLMSVLFMTMSVVIYSTHTSWKDRADKLTKQLEEVKTKSQQLLDARNDIERGLNEELSRRVTEIANLTTRTDELDKENKQFKEELTKLNEQKEQGIAAVKLSHESLAALRAEVEGLRKDLRKSQEDWASLSSDLVAKTDEAHGLAMKLATFRSVSERLTKDYQDACEVLRKLGKVPDPARYEGIPPKNIEGIVTEVRPNGWIEISVGEDSGVMKGHRLDIVRDLGGRQSYIGKIEIVKAEPDRAAAMVLPEYRKGTVQRDDIVKNIGTTPSNN